MKKSILKSLLCVAASLLVTCTACTNTGKKSETVGLEGNTFVIEGHVMPQDGDLPPEGTKIWLVPFFGPHPRPVDSCFVASDGSFRFEGDRELMAIIRLGQMARYGYQDLLVCTEPGRIEVVIDSRSSGKGTPKNEALQEWKQHIEDYNMAIGNALHAYKEGQMDSTTYRIETKRHADLAGSFVYGFLSKRGSDVMTRCLNTMRFGNLSAEQKAELNELLKDTTNYNLPQPGFHR